jgi:phosphoribosylglycinamide formyltransferase 1
VVVLVSGSGTLLQALLEACDDERYGVEVVAVGADRDGIAGLERGRSRGIATFVVPTTAYQDRAAWDRALADAIGEHRPVLVVSAGFMKILGAAVLDRFTVVNTHPALLPSFPGAHAVRDALAHGVRVTGCTLHEVDAGVDTGPIIAQRPVEVREGDDEQSLHERIKTVERAMLVEELPGLAGRAARGAASTDH